MGVGHSIPRMIGCGLDEAEMHLWCRDLPGDYGGIENVPTTSMFEKLKRFAQLQDLGEGRMKKARCGKCQPFSLWIGIIVVGIVGIIETRLLILWVISNEQGQS